jgi:hypothetical protein
LFAANGNGKQKFVLLVGKRSANVPIYAFLPHSTKLVIFAKIYLMFFSQLWSFRPKLQSTHLDFTRRSIIGIVSRDTAWVKMILMKRTEVFTLSHF